MSEWNRVEATRLGAALAFYSMLSIAPLLVVAIAIAGLVLGQAAVRGELASQIQSLVGEPGASAIQQMVEASATRSAQGIIASTLGFLTLLWGASAVVGELRSSLNKIWEASNDDSFRGFVMGKTYALALVLAAGFLLLLSLLVSAFLAGLSKHLGAMVSSVPYILELWNTLTSLGVGTVMFALIIRGIPNVEVSWRQVIPGALLTAILFTAGKYAIGLYLGRAGLDSTYGAAGSLVVFLLWVYYASQILYLGAIVTKVLVRHSRRREVASGELAPNPH